MRRLAASLRPAALPGACRLLSAVAGAAPAAELKSLLRLLYLRVHPDLVARHKEAAEVNSRSFSSLQQWLALASPGEGEAGGFARAPVRVEFYVHEEDNAELRRVSLVLPPPARAQPGAPVDAVSGLTPASAHALGSLFTACGLEHSLARGQSVAALPPGGLLAALPAAAELLRRSKSDAGAADDLLRMARAALRMRRGIMLSFSGPAAAAEGGAARAELARKLAAALDSCPEGHMRGCAIVLGDRTGVDPGTGACWLHTAEAGPAWRPRLMAMDLAAAAAGREAAATLKAREAAVAAAIGVVALVTEGSLARTAAYGEFLQRMVLHAASQGPVLPAGELSSLPVRVGPAPEQPEMIQTGSPAGYEVDAGGGAHLSVPVTAAGADVYAFLRHAGPKCVAARAAAAAGEVAATEAGVATRKSLRLRHLLRGEGVSAASFMEACARLGGAREALAPLMEGLPVRIVSSGNQHARLSACRQLLEIGADFKLR